MSNKKDMLSTITKIIKNFNAFCEKQLYNSARGCDGCPFNALCVDNDIDNCAELLIKKPEEFMNILYPPSFGEEVCKLFPGIFLDRVCVCDLLGSLDEDYVCDKYETCEAHYDRTKEEILEEMKEAKLQYERKCQDY